MKSQRILISEQPFDTRDEKQQRAKKLRSGEWPASWIDCEQAAELPWVCAFRKRFTLDNATTLRVHVTADNRYELFVDGEFVGRGSERGDERNWFFETYELDLEAVSIQSWRVSGRCNQHRPRSRNTACAPVFCWRQKANTPELISTGQSEWDAKPLDGYSFVSPSMAWGTGDNVVVDGAAFSWGFERGEGEGWQPARVLHHGSSARLVNDHQFVHELKPATLPAQLNERRQVGRVFSVVDISSLETHSIAVNSADNIADEQQAWQSLVLGQGSVTIAANTRRRVLVDLEDYYCAYPEVTRRAAPVQRCACTGRNRCSYIPRPASKRAIATKPQANTSARFGWTTMASAIRFCPMAAALVSSRRCGGSAVVKWKS
jgi:hypothetical protein